MAFCVYKTAQDFKNRHQCWVN